MEKQSHWLGFRCQSAPRAGEPPAGGDSWRSDFAPILQSWRLTQPGSDLEKERWNSPSSGEKFILSTASPFLVFPPFSSICINSVCSVMPLVLLGFWHSHFFPCLFVGFFCCVLFHPVSWCLFRPFPRTVSISLSPTVSMRCRDVLTRCRSVHLSSVCCLSHTNPSSMSHFAHLACCLLSACFNK